MDLRKPIGIALALAAASSASAAEPAGTGPDYYVLSGTCAAMTIDGEDVTEACQGKLVSFTTANGRVGFIFAFGKALLTFSGAGDDQTLLPGERASQPIDTIRLTKIDTDPGKPKSTPATGTCVYGNPFAGATTIACTATVEKSVLHAEFVTDGTPPSGGAM